MIFEKKIECPHCKREIEAPPTGKYNCKSCKTDFMVMESKKKLYSQLTFLDIYFTFNGRLPVDAIWLYLIIPLFIVRIVTYTLLKNIFLFDVEIKIIIDFFLLSPILSISVKRWHDRDKSAWWLLMYLVPIIGWIWVFIELALLDGPPGKNKYGDDPLEKIKYAVKI